jgi:hypothetical protein
MSSHETAEDSNVRSCAKNCNEASSSQQETLSRSSVYASLKSLDASDKTSASSMTRIPKSVQDESFISFYETISNDYHRKFPRLDGKNTSGRPLSASEISGRIRQRALTLVGGGFNAKNVVSANSRTAMKKALHTDNLLSRGNHPSSNLSGLHRKRKRTNLWRRMSVNCSNSFDDNCTKDQIGRHDKQFLMRMNDEWNAYMRNRLTLDSSVEGSLIDRTLLQTQIATLTKQDLIEWVGALVQIKECIKNPKSKERLVDMKGILISHTAFCWKIIPIRYKEETSKPKIDPSGSSNMHSHATEGSFMENHDCHHGAAITIPKVGSSIAVQIPLSPNNAVSNETRDDSQFISVLLKGN